MCSARQRFLHQFAALGAFLRRVARTHSDHLTASTLSLAAQDRQKRAPRGVQNALCQSTARQRPDVQVFHDDGRISIRILLRGLEMKVAALALEKRCVCATLHAILRPRRLPVLRALKRRCLRRKLA